MRIGVHLGMLESGGPGSGCNPDAGKCGRPAKRGMGTAIRSAYDAHETIVNHPDRLAAKTDFLVRQRLRNGQQTRLEGLAKMTARMLRQPQFRALPPDVRSSIREDQDEAQDHLKRAREAAKDEGDDALQEQELALTMFHDVIDKLHWQFRKEMNAVRAAMMPSGDEGLNHTVPEHGHPEEFNPPMKHRKKATSAVQAESGGQSENSSLTNRSWIVVDGRGRVIARYGTYGEAFRHANAQTGLRVRMEDWNGMHRGWDRVAQTRRTRTLDDRARQLGLRRKYEREGILVKRRSVGYPNPTASNFTKVGG